MKNNELILSPSSLNLFIKDKALWVLKHFYNIRGESNIYSIRGKLTELYVNLSLEEEKEISFDHFVEECQKQKSPSKGLNFRGITKPYLTIEGIDLTKDDLVGFYEWGKYSYSKLSGTDLISMQKQVLCGMDGMQLGGYLDYEYRFNTVDLKTVNKLPIIVSRGERKGMISKTKVDNVRQQFIYQLATNKEADLLYCTPTESLLYRITIRDAEEVLPSIRQGIKDIKKLLTLSIEDVILNTELGKMGNPFMWTDELKSKAKTIWRL